MKEKQHKTGDLDQGISLSEYILSFSLNIHAL